MATTQDIEAGLKPGGIGPQTVSPVPTIDFNAPAPNAPTQTFPTDYVPPDAGRILQPWQVEDRNTYIRAQQQLSQQQQAEWARIQQMIGAARRLEAGPAPLSAAANFQNLQAQYPGASPEQLAKITQQQGPPELTPDAALADLSTRGIDPSDPRYNYLKQLAQSDPLSYFAQVGRNPNPTGVGIQGFFKPFVQAATADVPFMQPVAEAAKNVGERVGSTALKVAEGPLAPAEQLLPNAVRPSTIAGNVVGLAAESLVPTQVWQLALELLPGVGTVPDLVRAVKAGTPDAIAALTRAGKQLGEDDTVKAVVRKLSGEAGVFKEPGSEGPDILKAAEARAGEAVQPAAATPPSPEPDLSVLGKGDRARIKAGGVGNALVVAERYARDSVQRQTVIDAVRAQIADLPETDQKLIVASMETLPSKAERKAATEAQRARQAVRGNRAFDETAGTPFERATASFKAFAGKQAQRFTPVGSRFTDAESGDLQARVVEAAAAGRIGRVFERNNALDALSLLMTGKRLPGREAKPNNLMPHEIKLLGRVFGPQVEAALPRTPEHFSAFHRLVDILNMPRAIVTALDVSAAGRQGILLAFRNPVEVVKSIKPMLVALKSEGGFQRMSENLRANRAWDDALAHGLDITDLAETGNLPAAEEAFQTGLIDRLPFGLKQAVKGSERAFVMYLDSLRLLTYEKNLGRIENLAAKQGWDEARTTLVKSQVATFLNHATGRGDIGFLGNYAPAMNAVFFAPRFFVSRPQSVWDMVRPGADPVTRRIAFENLGAFVGTGVSVLTTLKATGLANVELDPRSSDFGKIRFGNTRIDFWGGYQPIARYIAQFSTASNKELFTGKTKYVYPGQTALRFFRSKLSPGGSVIYDYTVGQGRNYNGDALFFSDPKALGLNRETATKAWNDFGQRILPLSLQDAVNGYQETGTVGGGVSGGVSIVGGGVSSFAPSEKQASAVEVQKFDKTIEPLGASVVDGRVYPDVLKSDWQGDAWHQVFAQDNPELGDISQYKTYADLRTAYVDYWYTQLGDQGFGERQTKAEFANAFDKQAASKQWASNVQLETLNFWKAHPDALKQATQLGLNTLNEDERKSLATPVANP